MNADPLAVSDDGLEKAVLTVNLDPAVNTGGIIHGAAGFLYGISSADVPTTNTVVPLKSKILVTKGALGTEHPYGDALDVAKTFLESGGEQIQMYNSNYYGVFGVTATREQYCSDLINYICPAVVGWKEAWKEEHGTPDSPKEAVGARVDIDSAIVYVPINEGTPSGGNFQQSWKAYYDSIKSVDPKAHIAGPNGWGYNGGFTGGQSDRTFVQFCADNNCLPNVYTWHELATYCLRDLAGHISDFRSVWAGTDWTKYNASNGYAEDYAPEMPQICINEYAEAEYCGVPGRLVNWIARLEDEKITGALPFWHQANNLNDLASDVNEGNGAWWLYKWYGDMSGVTQPVGSTTDYSRLYGLSAMDENKQSSTTLLGGFGGDITVRPENITETAAFAGAKAVHVAVREAAFTGFLGTLSDPPVILEGAYPVTDGCVTVKINGAKFESAYNVTVTPAGENEAVGLPLWGDAGKIYEAENAELSGGAYADYMAANPTFYFSNDGDTGYKGVKMDKGGVMTYTVEAPADGKYRFDFNYANGTGSHRNDMSAHDPKNVEQTYSLDGKREQAVIMNNTLFETITGTCTLYYDLTAGTHTVAVKTTGEGTVSHDFLRVTYAGAYGKDVPLFDKLYEAEQADFNLLLGNTDTAIKTESALEGYSGNGYVTGISERTVTEGGSIVSNENIVEPGGEYTLTVCPDKEHVLGRILINGADRTAEAVEHDGKYSLTVKGVSDNQTAEAYFAGAAVPKEALAAFAGALDIKDRGDYTEDSYNAFAAAKSYAEAVLKKAGAYQCETDSAYKDLFLAVNGLEAAGGGTAAYFVDCGDHDPSTLSSGDSLGTNNSLTDMIYGEDPVTKMMWGAVDPKNSYIPTGGGNRTKSKGAYTTWTWANENSPGEIADGQPKEATFRYARNQDSEGITPRRVEYKFELAPGLYDLKVCVGNYWGNSGNVDIYANGEKINENTVSVPALRHFDFFCS